MLSIFKKKNKTKETGDLSRKLTLPLAMEEGRVPKVLSMLLYVASGFIALGLIWSSITQIRELTVAPGEIRPSGSVQLVQHFEGGIVSEIYAKEGEIVEAGAPLVRLRPNAAEADLAQLKIRRANLQMSKERLTALIEDRQPDFGILASQHPKLAKQQMEQMQTAHIQKEKERETLALRIEQRESELEALKLQTASLKKQVVIQQGQLKIKQDLLKEGLVSRVALLDSKTAYQRTIAEAASIKGQRKSAEKQYHEARVALLELDANTKKTLQEERLKTSAELAELNETVGKQQDKVTRLIVRAPVRGLVQELPQKAIGEVVKPGDLVAKVVPLNQELVAEVQVQPADIGHIKLGATTEVKVTTYDYARYGAITGKLQHISATTFQTEKGEPYYKAVIALDKSFVGSGKSKRDVLPGMVVQADIITGAKSLTKYMLKPVYRSLDIAFSER